MENVEFSVKPNKRSRSLDQQVLETTMINLLMRFYPLNGGKILLDDQDMMSFSAPAVRKNSVWCCKIRGYSKEPSLKISLMAIPMPLGRHLAAAKAAQCDHFVRTLPNGYDTVIGSKANCHKDNNNY